MHTINLIASAISDEQKEPLPVTSEKGICCVTGELTDTIPRKKLFGANFSDANRLARPDSDRVGVSVWLVMQFGEYGIKEDGTRKKRKKKPEYMSCWWTDGQVFREVKKPDIRRLVLGGTSAKAWAGWVTTSYKKHGALRSPVNNREFGIWGFDDVLVDARDKKRVLDWWRILRQAQDAGIGRKSMEAVDMPVGIMLKVGIDVWGSFAEWARPQYQSPLYQFLIYLLPSKKELVNNYEDMYD